MKKLPIYTLTGLTAGLAAVPLLWVGHWPLAAALSALGGYLVAMKEFSKFTGRLQFFTQVFTGLMVGVALEYPFEHFPFLVLTMFFAILATFGRIMFFRFFGYTGKTWFEISTLILAFISHIAGNMIAHSDAIGWLVPAPALVFACIITWGIVKDKKQLFAGTGKGYRVAIG